MARTQNEGAFVQCVEDEDAASGGPGRSERGKCRATGNSQPPRGDTPPANEEE